MARLLSGSGTISGGATQAELDAFTGSTNIATLGTVGTGTWQGTTVAVNQGGTGAATHTANNVMIGAGTSALTSIAPGADGEVLTSTGTVWQSEAAGGGGGGITHASQWLLTSSLDTANEAPITANLAEVVAGLDGYGRIGASFAAPSSGVFTFPATGIWQIRFTFLCYAATTHDDVDTTDVGLRGFAKCEIFTTTNDSTYDGAAEAMTNLAKPPDEPRCYGGATCDFLFDVTDTATHKCRFGVSCSYPATAITFQGQAAISDTFFSFVRLGDT